MKDVLGQAIHDYQYKTAPGKLWIHNQYGPKEPMPVAAYFRTEDDMPDLEWLALNECRGKVLDIGAGAGSHTLELQQRGYEVTAIDISPLAVEVMHQRGVKEAHVGDIFTYQEQQYDTLLLLMNGIGLAGNLLNLERLLIHLKTLLSQGGQLLFDSSNIAYLYEGKLPDTGYYGNIMYQYEYKNQKSEWFEWLYVDMHTLQKVATATGWNVEVLYEDDFEQYLVRLITL
ncbi:class I SAM-dependent methyltransferase [Mucilaginibacter sp. PAMB04274]|uniref:class I SAM-dependent methyltransferase n=1 Tax=Mucilaginibacter sp. PAMB04274 TaxID=3138568 RepID=UPI0031F65C4B